MDGAVTLALAALAYVSYDRHGVGVELGWWKGDGEIGTATIRCRDFEARDRLFAQLRLHLGEGWQPREVKSSRLRASLTPGLLAAVVAGVTAGLWWLATDVAEMAARRGGKLPPGAKNFRDWFLAEILLYLTPTGVLILGGLGLAGAVWWLFRRLKVPPDEIVLSRVPVAKN
jgi:hypothetical protein